VFSGSKAEAERRTREIVEAYEVLGNPANRRAYDSARRTNGFGNYQEEEQTTSSSDEIAADWEMVKKYHPETERLYVDLGKLSPSLAFTFQITVLEKKLGSNAYAIAKTIESEFFQRYFGHNPSIHKFVRSALLEGRRDVAQEVNRAIKVFGTPGGPNGTPFIKRVQETMKYTPSKEPLLTTFGYTLLILIIVAGFIAAVVGSR
jgi:curved DNA-binding protein CbpA